MVHISNSQISKLGDRLRASNCDRAQIETADLELLQQYRHNFKDSLNDVFNILSNVSKRVHKSRIVSFRIKKIDTILSKLLRFKSMRLDQIGDIAGCRAIVQSEHAVYRIRDILYKVCDVKGENDRMKTPDIDGYRALHLYVKPKNIQDAKLVEIQLRTSEQHYWSTLVEIVDVLYDTRIKEGFIEDVPELSLFLKNYSEIHRIPLEEKIELIEIESKFGIYKEMIETFTVNVVRLRQEWLQLESFDNNEAYLVFMVDKDKKSANYSVYHSYDQAESHYFNMFKNSEQDFLVCHLDVNNFQQLTIAYANYMLTDHEFLDGWIDIIIDVIRALILKKDFNNLELVHTSFLKITSSLNESLKAEEEMVNFNLTRIESDEQDFHKKLLDWFKKISERKQGIKTKIKVIEIEIEPYLRARGKKSFLSLWWNRLLRNYE